MPATHLSHTASTHSPLLSQHPSLHVLEGKSREIAEEQKAGGEMEATFNVALQLLQGVKPTSIAKNFFPFQYPEQKFRVGNCDLFEDCSACPPPRTAFEAHFCSCHPWGSSLCRSQVGWTGMGPSSRQGLAWEHLIFRISAGYRKVLLMIPCTRQIYFNKFNVDLIYSILLRGPG